MPPNLHGSWRLALPRVLYPTSRALWVAPLLSLELFINWELGDKYLHHLLSSVSEKGELNVPKQKNPGNFPGPLSPLPISLQIQKHRSSGSCSSWFMFACGAHCSGQSYPCYFLQSRNFLTSGRKRYPFLFPALWHVCLFSIYFNGFWVKGVEKPMPLVVHVDRSPRILSLPSPQLSLPEMLTQKKNPLNPPVSVHTVLQFLFLRMVITWWDIPLPFLPKLSHLSEHRQGPWHWTHAKRLRSPSSQRRDIHIGDDASSGLHNCFLQPRRCRK